MKLKSINRTTRVLNLRWSTEDTLGPILSRLDVLPSAPTACYGWLGLQCEGNNSRVRYLSLH